MFFKILGSTIIGLMLIAGCKSGGNQEGEKEKEQPSLQEQQMPEQMQQQDIEVSDEEIQKFVDAVKKIQSIDRGTQQEMVKTVEDEGMSTQRFREIQKSQQSQEGQGDITDEEKKQYQRIMQKFQNLQAGMQEEMKKVVEDAGLTMERYQQIGQAAQQDTALLKRIQSSLQPSMGNQ